MAATQKEKDNGKVVEGLLEELKSFDFVQFTVPDIHGVPKGRLVPREQLAKACRDGVGIFSGTQYFGMQSEVPAQIDAFTHFPNGVMTPIPGSGRPLAWSSSPQRRIGQVMCQFDLDSDLPYEQCPRSVAQRQVDRLQEQGFRIKSAFECECDILDAKTMEPLGGNYSMYANLDLLDRHLGLFTDMLNVLRDSGVHVEYFFPEWQPGQYEVSMQPQWGVGSADDAFMFRYGARAFCARHDLTATFMSIPFSHFHSTGFHFNHSVWSLDGERNVFYDPQDPLKLSATARHWLAGLLHHAPALTALTCPTVNCYRRLQPGGFAPATIFWDVDNRLSAVRAKTAKSNVFLENRIPSSACNPYLTLAATIAAGVDGVQRQLPCPKPGEADHSQESRSLPSSLSQALEALDKDQVIKDALGPTMVDYFVTLKRDFEVSRFQKVITKEMEAAEQVTKEREYYMPII